MAKKQKPSPAYQLLELVWDKTARGSWDRLNRSMQAAMALAISAKFTFSLVDFRDAMERFRGDYWFRGEDWYALAVTTGNLSAAKAFEAWKTRPPFIIDGTDNRKRGRLAVGSRFPWQGHQLTVTSFAEDGSYLTACSYRERKANDYSNKVAKRVTITVAGIRQERAAQRERRQLRDRAQKLVDAGAPCGKILARHGVATEREWLLAGVEKLRTVVEELEEEVTTDGETRGWIPTHEGYDEQAGKTSRV